ncbi:Nudix-like NDP and NTP phosphohydrolase NudJ [hydrothermal vent metagenome]|uniref:Phosphatase NudJ n=1 Tax=hydrothermal vent metagenome TaxID=652676 RepID=A0A3B1BHH3_9ZZZZ
MVEECIEGKTVLNQPAGHLENGESFIEAVIRETQEETAWKFSPETMIGIYRWVHPDSGATFLRHCFAGIVDDYSPDQTLDDGIIRSVWLSREQLEQQRNLRSPLVLQCTDDYLSGQTYPLEILKDQI